MPYQIKDATGAIISIQTASGDGSSGNPYVTQRATQQTGFTTGQLTNVSVGTTATALPASALANRKLVRVTNPANPFGYPTTITVGYANTIVAMPSAGAGAAGWQLQPGQSRDFVVAAGQALYGITTTQAIVVMVEEFA